MFQQRPFHEGGSIFRDDWWLLGDVPEPGDGPVFQFWDTAFKTGQQNDYSVCCTMTTTPNGYAVLDVWRNRVGVPGPAEGYEKPGRKAPEGLGDLR